MSGFLSQIWKTSKDTDDSFVVVDEETSASQDDLPATFRLPDCKNHNLYEITVDELQHLFSFEALTSVDYTKFCLERIQMVNPYLECVIETNPDALHIATQLDRERSEGRTRGPLHGIPVLVKDNMATKDRMETTAGSWALLGCIVPKDAHIVSLLRKAGAIILGKSNLDEWAGMRSSVYSNGYSARGGQCRNPYILSRSAEGSSSGPAASVSANIVPLSFGTETDTSIIWPAMVCGVVAIKPTVGLTSRAGVIPISETQDSVGPYGRTVADAVRALDVVAGADPDDKFSTAPERRQEKSYYDCLADKKMLKGAKFGLPMKRFWELAPKPQRKVAEKVLRLIEDAGAEVIPVEMPCAEERIHEDGRWDWERYGDTNPAVSEITVSKVETYYLMNDYLSKLRNTPIKTLEDIVRFNDENRGSEGGHAGDLPAWPDGQKLFREVLATKGIKDGVCSAALSHIRKQCRENGIDAALKYRDEKTGKQVDLDALLFCDIKGAGQQIAAQAAYPIINLPVGIDPDGMPVSLTLQHTAWREGTLVKWASAIEDVIREELGPRETPKYKNHLAKNIPIEMEYRYPGAPPAFGEPPRD
ncbi:amidase [Delphinella strobiligena]|nr:amidase [Delphinella strobiligena]